MRRLRNFWLPRAFAFLIAGTFLFSEVAMAEQEGVWEQVKRSVSLRNTIQGGLEYDTNVYKTFGNDESDLLFRALFRTQGSVPIGPNSSWGWEYQGGAKVYFHETAQDMLIHSLELPYQWAPRGPVALKITPELKFQDERDSYETQTAPTDINEDYLSLAGNVALRLAFPKGFVVEPFFTYTYFHFDPQDDFSFHRERAGGMIRKRIHRLFTLGTQYAYSRQQFLGNNREDVQHEISGILQFTSIPYFSSQYSYQDMDSNDRRFSYSNHRVSLIVSVPIGARGDAEMGAAEGNDSSSWFVFHVIGTLQLKRFPDVFDQTAEGQRFLLTGAEDENFNSILVKVSFHPFPSFAVEAKYTRYSNELSSQVDSFQRSLLYGGIRYSF